MVYTDGGASKTASDDALDSAIQPSTASKTKAGITTALKLKKSNTQLAACKKRYYNYHKTFELQEKRQGYFNAQMLVVIPL
jgi:hypothetical protein